MKNWEIKYVYWDGTFGGVIVDVTIDGKLFQLGCQLDCDSENPNAPGAELYVGRDCWAFIDGDPLDDGTVKITKICPNEDRAYHIFWEIINHVIDERNEVYRVHV